MRNVLHLVPCARDLANTGIDQSPSVAPTSGERVRNALTVRIYCSSFATAEALSSGPV